LFILLTYRDFTRIFSAKKAAEPEPAAIEEPVAE
jgi:hypothetical protein